MKLREARSSGRLCNNTGEQAEQEDNRAELGRGQKPPAGDCKETLETGQRGIWRSKHQVVGGGHARLHTLLPRSVNRYLIKPISSGAAVNVRRKKRDSSDVCKGAQRTQRAREHSARWAHIQTATSVPRWCRTAGLPSAEKCTGKGEHAV